MARLAQSNPLHNSDSIAVLPVSTYLKEPIFQTPGNKRKRLTQRILHISGQLELLLNREQLDYVQMVAVDEKVNKLTRLLKTLIAEHDELNRTVQAYFEETGFSELFPCTMARLSLESVAVGKQVRNSGIHGHFQHLSSLNQLIGMCIELSRGLKLPDHYFIPHQLTVLYHFLGAAGVDYKKYKARIEVEFDKIRAHILGEGKSSQSKASTGSRNLSSDSKRPETKTLDAYLTGAESLDSTATVHRPSSHQDGGRTQLSAYHVRWLSELTSDIVIQALYRKGPIRHASRPLARVLQC
ncbi:hypothetical protein H4R35_002008 [Dimargaris xerosporica]|nr:hypothetical protein H4R35_002008 [Dimargaris xerosporica]